MIMMPARGWRWTTIWRMPKSSVWHITRVCGKVSHLQFAPDKSTYRRSCVFFRFFFSTGFFSTALVWFSSTSPEEDPLWGVWQPKTVLSTRLLLRNSHRCESQRHSIYALGISHSAQHRWSRRLRVRHPSGVISSAGLRCAGCQPDSCNPPMVQFGTLRCRRVGWKAGRVWQAFWSFLIITPFDIDFQTFKMGTDAVQFDVPGAWSSSDSFNDHSWILDRAWGSRFETILPALEFCRAKTRDAGWELPFKSEIASKKGGVPPKKEQISGFNIRSNASMSLIITQYFPCIFHGVFHGQNRGHQCLQRQRHALVAALAATKPLERLAQQRRQVALSLQAVQALQRLGFGKPMDDGDFEVQPSRRFRNGGSVFRSFNSLG